MVLKRMGFKPLRKREAKAGIEMKGKAPAKVRKAPDRVIAILQPVSPGGNV